MKFNRHSEVRGDFDSKLVFNDLANYDYSTTLAVNTLSHRSSQISNSSQPSTNEYQANFFIMKGKDDKLENELSFKDIFSKSKVDDKEISKASSTTDEKKEESWRYNRKWLSTVFMIWFLLAFALLINAIYY